MCIRDSFWIVRTHRAFHTIGVDYGSSMLSVVRSLIWIPTTFILSSTRFRCSSINGGHSASSRLRRFPTGVSCHQSPGTWLVTDFFHSLYNAIPVFKDYFCFSLVKTNFILSPRVYPYPPNHYCIIWSSYDTSQYLDKVWPSREFSLSRLRMLLLGHMGGISLLWLS